MESVVVMGRQREATLDLGKELETQTLSYSQPVNIAGPVQREPGVVLHSLSPLSLWGGRHIQ